MEGLSYIPALLAAFDAGHAGRDIHLGLDAAEAPEQSFTEVACGDDPVRALIEAQARMTALHLDALDAGSGQRIADLGCGIGGAISQLDARLEHAELVGINIDPRQLARAQSFRDRGRNLISWREGCVSRILGEDLQLHRALSIEAMFHFPEPAGFLESLARSLRPGGRAVISTILFAPASDPVSAKARAVITHGFAPWPAPDLSLPDLVALAGDAGLRVEQVLHLENRLHRTMDLLMPEPPPTPTANPVVELRRLLDLGGLIYPMLTLTKTGEP